MLRVVASAGSWHSQVVKGNSRAADAKGPRMVDLADDEGTLGEVGNLFSNLKARGNLCGQSGM